MCTGQTENARARSTTRERMIWLNVAQRWTFYDIDGHTRMVEASKAVLTEDQTKI